MFWKIFYGKRCSSVNSFLLFFAFLFLFAIPLKSQDSREELSKRYLNIGKQLLKTENYDSALKVLKLAFVKNALLPDELLYYYSFALYKKGDVDQSKKALDKFLSLTTSQSDLYSVAILLKAEIDRAIDELSIPCENCKGVGHFERTCTFCDDSGHQVCSICSGKGKVIIGGAAGMRFGTCTICKGKGLKACEKCDGSKIIKETCNVCKGKGKVRPSTN